MKRLVITSFLAVAALAVIATGVAMAHGDNGGTSTKLEGYQETPLTLSTSGRGTFRIRLRSDGIHYVLKYSDLEADALFAHIHLGQRGTTGGVIAFLCGGGTKPAPCPARAGRVEGVIAAADVVGPTVQGIEVGNLVEAVRALRRGYVYANVHTTKYTGGEIRGQIGGDDDRGHKRDR
ncbi:MAG TPA: CHRD domain-containing protein [Gaiellaceae bacterium]|nr:CHRD domain-containing protein [Gaiellaceae bacterium]